MIYSEFEKVITPARLGRYRTACGGDTRKAMTLYRKNLKLSQEMFTVVSCFEVALRNGIDRHYTTIYGNNWLRTAAAPGGFFDNNKTRVTQGLVNSAVSDLNHNYTHFKLIAELGFGFWRYMYSRNQYRVAGKTLLRVFPSRPSALAGISYNSNDVFNILVQINDLRNRIAHHEPICFLPAHSVKDTTYARQHYNLIIQLFQWMQIDEAALLYGIDHINTICNEIDAL
ncbi:Abi family protein [Flavobacterium sp.]|uniref:Abi family protein n=1 Tax=Flavobacterium sp. TaxID=239 RepID=UPI00286DD51A|nr:Abi family protein [Flavobacterium sp.]